MFSLISQNKLYLGDGCVFYEIVQGLDYILFNINILSTY